MPNIEIHGAKPQQAKEMFGTMSGLFEGAKYRSEIVVTIVNDVTYDLYGTQRPFLRVVLKKIDPVDLLEDCKKRLAPLAIDIEILTICEFIPK